MGSPRAALALGALATSVLVAVVIVLGVRPAVKAPQRFAMIVWGTSLALGAHRDTTLTKTSSGCEIQLAVAGRQHLGGGRYYRAWLKNPAGVLAPVGTYNDAKPVTLSSGVPVTWFQTLTVTGQQASGNSASSGERVLIGRLDH